MLEPSPSPSPSPAVELSLSVSESTLVSELLPVVSVDDEPLDESSSPSTLDSVADGRAQALH